MPREDDELRRWMEGQFSQPDLGPEGPYESEPATLGEAAVIDAVISAFPRGLSAEELTKLGPSTSSARLQTGYRRKAKLKHIILTPGKPRRGVRAIYRIATAA